jgi:hypothetical protein
MYGKTKSPEFIAMQTRDKSGPNNPLFGIKKSSITRAKLTKNIYVYNYLDLSLIDIFGTVQCAKKYKMGNDTLKKYLKSGRPFKEKIFSYTKLH